MRYDWSEAFLRKRKTGAFTSLMQAVRANAVAQKTKTAPPPESGKVQSLAPPGHTTRDSASGKVQSPAPPGRITRASSSRAIPWDMLLLLHCSTCPAPPANLKLSMLHFGKNTLLECQGLAGLPPQPASQLM